MFLKNLPEVKVNPFLEALGGRRPDVVPVWFMRQAGRFLPEYRRIREQVGDFFELCRNIELAVEVTALPVRLLGVDAAILFSDLLVPLLPLRSMDVALKEGVGPVIELKVPLDSPDLFHKYEVEEELGFVGEIVSGFKELYPDVPLIGFCGAPFTLLSYVIEGGGSKVYHRTKRFMFEQKRLFEGMCDRLVDILVDYALMQVKSGVDAFQVFDSWAGALSPEDYREYVFASTRRLIEGIRASGIPVIYFSTGTAGALKIIRDLPADAFSVDWRIDIADAIDILGPDRVIQGNLDPSALFMPEDALAKRIEGILLKATGAKAHIFNLGHGVFPDTDPGRVKWVVELVHRFTP